MMRIEYAETTFQRVAQFWADKYKMKKGETLYNHEATYDPSTGKIIFKLYIQSTTKEPKP